AARARGASPRRVRADRPHPPELVVVGVVRSHVGADEVVGLGVPDGGVLLEKRDLRWNLALRNPENVCSCADDTRLTCTGRAFDRSPLFERRSGSETDQKSPVAIAVLGVRCFCCGPTSAREAETPSTRDPEDRDDEGDEGENDERTLAAECHH